MSTAERTVAVVTPAQRLAEHRCLECFKGVPDVAFSVTDGRPHKFCSDCKARFEVQRALARREEEQNKDVAGFVKATLTSSVSVPAMREIAAKLTKKFGGVDSIVDEIYLNIRDVLDNKKGERFAFDVLKFLVRLIERGLEEERVELELSALSDEQLNDIRDRFLERYMAEGNGETS